MNASLPLVSVVIPTRGRAQLVCRAVESALAQTYSSIEVVVIVDGEDAATVDALHSIDDPRLRLMILAEPAGGSEARNRGVQQSKGEWIAFLDDDDIWHRNKLEIQMQAALKEKDDAVLITCRRINWEPGQPDEVAPWRVIAIGEDPGEYLFCPGDGRRPTSGPQTSGILASRALLRAVPFTPGLKCHQDWDWYLRAMNLPGIKSQMIEQPLYRMYKEQNRPSVTRIANWEMSLAWADGCGELLTPRAYIAFVIHECMYRCEVERGRWRIFRTLLAACRRHGNVRASDLLAALKWYAFPPSVRLRLRGLTRRVRQCFALRRPAADATGAFVSQAEAEG